MGKSSPTFNLWLYLRHQKVQNFRLSDEKANKNVVCEELCTYNDDVWSIITYYMVCGPKIGEWERVITNKQSSWPQRALSHFTVLWNPIWPTKWRYIIKSRDGWNIIIPLSKPMSISHSFWQATMPKSEQAHIGKFLCAKFVYFDLTNLSLKIFVPIGLRTLKPNLISDCSAQPLYNQNFSTCKLPISSGFCCRCVVIIVRGNSSLRCVIHPQRTHRNNLPVFRSIWCLTRSEGLSWSPFL